MAAALELFVLPWGVYPRRVLLYLAEKGISASPFIKITPVTITHEGMSAPEGKPPGTVPILKLPDGTFIKQSLAILDYFEDICDSPDPAQVWQAELADGAREIGSMRGNTPQERARIRDMICLADEANCLFTFASHKGVRLFVPMESTSGLTAKLALEYCTKNLRVLDAYYADDTLRSGGRNVNIADCVLFSLLHYSKGMFGLDLLSEPGLSNLSSFYEVFSKRESAMVKEDHFPEEVHKLASEWIPVDQVYLKDERLAS